MAMAGLSLQGFPLLQRVNYVARIIRNALTFELPPEFLPSRLFGIGLSGVLERDGHSYEFRMVLYKILAATCTTQDVWPKQIVLSR